MEQKENAALKKLDGAKLSREENGGKEVAELLKARATGGGGRRGVSGHLVDRMVAVLISGLSLGRAILRMSSWRISRSCRRIWAEGVGGAGGGYDGTLERKEGELNEETTVADGGWVFLKTTTGKGDPDRVWTLVNLSGALAKEFLGAGVGEGGSRKFRGVVECRDGRCRWGCPD